MVAFGSQHSGHVLIGDDPVVHVVAHDIRIEKVPVANLHPNAYGLSRRVRDQMFVELPGAVRSFGVGRPLLVHIGA